MNETVIIGLTGQTGAGKSTVSNLFRTMNMPVIDADVVARKVLDEDKSLILRLAEIFGNDIINKDKSLNRGLLASRAFSSKENVEKLNKIMFPAITLKMNKDINDLKNLSCEFIILDAPLLFESKLNELCTTVISVVADYNTRLDRIVTRDKITIELAKKRMSMQKSEEFFKNNSDFILDGGAKLDCFLQEAAQLIYKLRKKFGCE